MSSSILSRTQSGIAEVRFLAIISFNTVSDIHSVISTTSELDNIYGGSIGKRADPNSVRPGTRPVGRYTGRVSGWDCYYPLRIGHSSGGLRWRQNTTRGKLLKIGQVTVGGQVTRRDGRIVRIVTGQALIGPNASDFPLH